MHYLLVILTVAMLHYYSLMDNKIMAYPSLAKVGCQATCGNITIPFPFGIQGGPSTDCYHDKWFEIYCDEGTNPPRAFLKSINLEVLNIPFGPDVRYGSVVRVRYPITYSQRCSFTSNYYKIIYVSNLSNLNITLEGSPFLFSQSRNIFIAVGCNTLALMSSIESVVIGCRSTCVDGFNEAIKPKQCLGNSCCQAMVGSGMKTFNVTFTEIDSKADQEGCSYAFLVDKQWLEKDTRSLYEVQQMMYVPVILDWGLNSSALYKLGLHFYYNGCDSHNRESTYTCGCTVYDSLISWNLYNSNFTQCSCSPRLLGNPYIQNGCQRLLIEWGDISDKVIIGLFASMGLMFSCLIIWESYKLIKKRKITKLRKEFFRRNGGLLLEEQLYTRDGNVEKTRLFTAKELDKATDQFNKDRIIGQGGQGTVYKGMLTDGRIIAVKKSKIVDPGKLGQFINEVIILSQINHRNVVKLLGCCLETEVPLLVYEFIPNGTLSQYIHDENKECCASWEMRLQIAIEIAGALSYLHSAASIPIYHRDIKSSNILLDAKYRAKIADFGTSTSMAIDQTHLTTKVQGTFGYLDPEYFRSSKFTDKSDVYSFGVVLLELLTGEKPLSSTRCNEDGCLVMCFICASNEKQLFDLIDVHLLDNAPREEIMVVANLAKRCLNMNGKKRPTMKEVAVKLEGITMPKKDTSATNSHHEETEPFGIQEFKCDWSSVSSSTEYEVDISRRS